MSSDRSKRTTRETPSSVSSRARKRISGNEEPVDAPEPSIYRAGLCKNKFVQDFRNRTVIAGRWVDFPWFCESGFDSKEMFDFQDMFVMYCLITRTPMNLGHLMLNHMKAATEKKKQGLPYGMFFTHMFHVFEVELIGEVQEKPKDSKEYNKKTLRLMGFVQNDDGEWVKKGVVTPKKGGSDSEDEEETDTKRLPGEIGLLWGSKHPFLLLYC
ncbi:hypothetical protein CJ030_MR7G000022 [Morella rubra]|uniref:Uncharacterized protein n=1 Tax=Morella rubra TaxID=262757 RepID=A0A6A1V1G2_9ROSI|nr:hypothetical protein CJ030_MR7G000022 [Morella rubra]